MIFRTFIPYSFALNEIGRLRIKVMAVTESIESGIALNKWSQRRKHPWAGRSHDGNVRFRIG